MKSTIHDGLAGGRPTLSDPAPLRHKPQAWRRADWRRYKALSYRIAEDRARRLAEVKPRPASIISLAEEDLGNIASDLEFPATDWPIVSIIVPVFNNLRLTLECLTSVRQFADGVVPYEIIVADDASTDATPALLPLVRNAIYLRNDENLGFLRSCNRAAERARGELVLFLNNDVQVTAGWLPALTNALRKLPRAGAVGPRMIYPNGHLQEAGVLINSDCSTEFIGHNDDPGLPRYSFARRVDYCSGACLMLERARFMCLGGFNDELAPAYYEDVDLCLRLRRQGLDVWYVPESVVVHHRNKTSDSVGDGYAIRWGTRNRDKIAKLWQADIDALNRVRLLAFYPPRLPAIPRDERRWREVISQWIDVTRKKLHGANRDQPCRLGGSGFDDPEVFVQQAELARQAGIEGFCFRYEWSVRSRLPEQLLDAALSRKGTDFPFLLCLTSEEAARRGDGLKAELSIAQAQSDADDAAAIRDLTRYFRDHRYVRVDAKPLLLVQRVDALADFARTAATWRALCRKEGIGEIYLANVDCFSHDTSPALSPMLGCDATVQLPSLIDGEASRGPAGASSATSEAGRADYEALLLSALHQPLPAAPCFPTVLSGWRNAAQGAAPATHFKGASLGAFEAWLEAAIRRTREQNFGEERIAFIADQNIQHMEGYTDL